jgi:hypothetical protein
VPFPHTVFVGRDALPGRHVPLPALHQPHATPSTLAFTQVASDLNPEQNNVGKLDAQVEYRQSWQVPLVLVVELPVEHLPVDAHHPQSECGTHSVHEL